VRPSQLSFQVVITRWSATDGWDKTLKQEFNISYKEMLDVGVPKNQARKSTNDSLKYFSGTRESNENNPFFDILYTYTLN